MAKHTFLSDEWMEEARKIREEYRGRTQPTVQAVKMNQVITDVPFGPGTIEAHMDTTSGEVEMDRGHVEGADVTITLDYETARAVLVDANPQAGMQAWMAGKIKVDGDITKVMALAAGATPDPVSFEIQQRIKDITE